MKMHGTIYTLLCLVIAALGGALWLRGDLDRLISSPPVVPVHQLSQPEAAQVVAYGWIEGRTAAVEVTTRLSEQISEILVARGDWVAQGEVLMKLDNSRYSLEVELARAELAMAEAKLLKIQNGFRDSEVEAARNDYAACDAELEGAKRNLARLKPLLVQKNVSQQVYDEELSRVEMLKSMAEAARNRLLTMQAPPRQDDLMEAEAAVAAAHSKLSLAALNLQRTNICSPMDGRVLRVNAELGELAQPTAIKPLITLSDVRELRAVVEIDEFDALAVRVGQQASVTTDSVPGVLAAGTVVEVEPEMAHKQLDTSRPGVRLDTFVRRVWIALENVDNIPIGLPVEVSIALTDHKDVLVQREL